MYFWIFIHQVPFYKEIRNGTKDLQLCRLLAMAPLSFLPFRMMRQKRRCPSRRLKSRSSASTWSLSNLRGVWWALIRAKSIAEECCNVTKWNMRHQQRGAVEKVRNLFCSRYKFGYQMGLISKVTSSTYWAVPLRLWCTNATYSSSFPPVQKVSK